MKRILASLLLVSLGGCLAVPVDSGNPGGGKGGGDTTVVCHKGKKTMELPTSAAKAHLGHGDRLGPC